MNRKGSPATLLAKTPAKMPATRMVNPSMLLYLGLQKYLGEGRIVGGVKG